MATHDVIIAHMISGDAQTNRRGKHKAILGPVGCMLHMRPAGNEGSVWVMHKE